MHLSIHTHGTDGHYRLQDKRLPMTETAGDGKQSIGGRYKVICVYT